jgi:hypothetical protein
MKTKICVFNTNVKSALLYACETLKVTKQITKRVQVYVNHCLRCIMNRRRPDIMSNEDLWGAVSRRLPTAAAQIQSRVWLCGIL